MRFLLRVASRSARLRVAGQRARRGLSSATDANGVGVLRRARSDRTDDRWCVAPAPWLSWCPTSPSRAWVTRAVRTPRGPSARAKPSARMRHAFVREVLFGSRACDGIIWSQHGEIFFCIAQVSLLLRWDLKRRLRTQREREVLDPRSAAIADADPTGVGARKARHLEE